MSLDFWPQGHLSLGLPPSLPSGRDGPCPSSVSPRPVELKETGRSILKPGAAPTEMDGPLHLGLARQEDSAEKPNPLAVTLTFEIGTWKSPGVGQKLAREVILCAQVIAS